MADAFIGTWSYRSLINNPDLGVDFNDLRFGAAELKIVQTGAGKIGGSLGGPGWMLDLDGAAIVGTPTTLRWQGRGLINDEEWVYDYLGYLVQSWPDGVDQVPTIVGTVIRTVPHSGGQAKAGYTATFYAVLVSKHATCWSVFATKKANAFRA